MFYVYIQQSGFADIVQEELSKQYVKDREYFLLEVVPVRPDYNGKRYVNGAWVWGMSESENSMKRRKEMPTKALLEDLYKAMKSGETPKATKFFDAMDKLYKKYPDS
jgi:hypothetical protein